ncbi:MAG: hypothetical protein V7647_4249 [Acidobacteriota bacterium]|jgi:uncharacterized RDD family membrane protein YckC
MRCPKCHYISFDSTDRCRNCGYEFALTAEPPPLDLPIQTGNEALGPLADLPMGEFDNLDPSRRSARSAAPRRRTPVPVPDRETVDPPIQRPITSVFDLPLFKDRAADDDRLLVSLPAAPRQPVSVRRSSPVSPRGPRVVADEPVFDLDALEPEVSPIKHMPWLPKTEMEPGIAQERVSVRGGQVAGLLPRLCAGLADGGILAAICWGVLYITLQVCGLRTNQLEFLPIPPLAAFLVLLVGGYFVLLTAAGGQTLGKMAAGIRVVPMDSGERISLGHSVARAAGYLVSVLPAGLGLVPALAHADRRALHDRLADTRVVKA